MYYIMNKNFATIMLDKHPKAALYAEDTLVLTGEFPEGFDGTIVDIAAAEALEPEEFDPEALVAQVDALMATTHTGKLVILSKAQGRYLYDNHPAFMPEVEPEVEPELGLEGVT